MGCVLHKIEHQNVATPRPTVPKARGGDRKSEIYRKSKINRV